MAPKVKGLLERLDDGEYVIIAEGYVFEFERKGYLSAGPYTPQVVLEHPHLVKAMHEEFVHAGSDVVLAFTYYGNREKMRVIGWQDRVEEMNMEALRIAREVADETGTLMAGNICNTTCYDPNDESTWEYTKQCIEEQAQWAAEGGADFIVGETFAEYDEAKMCLDAILKHGKGAPAVVTYSPIMDNTFMYQSMTLAEGCRLLEEHGADVVGLNCARGPKTMLPLIKEVKKSCKGHVACLPVAYRTDEEHPTMQSLVGMETGTRAFPFDLDEWFIGRTAVENFTKECMDLGIKYLGLCCGGSAHTLRTMAETVGKKPVGSQYSPKMEMHTHFGNKDTGIGTYNLSCAEFVDAGLVNK
ncbi:betaine--homocysteine S-methyltransferase 1-like [Lineus longissimus]|uniref:betaine--homocysteine S-methyltransferase 1-like n=1 Tax=Lineus longissimus TaxID=88925 RepID=UPI002B4D6168